jgi:hypothetical protein
MVQTIFVLFGGRAIDHPPASDLHRNGSGFICPSYLSPLTMTSATGRLTLEAGSLDNVISPKNITADFVYVRLHGAEEPYRGACSAAVLSGWMRSNSKACSIPAEAKKSEEPGET